MVQKDSDKPTIAITGDGSETLYSPHFEQYYHNVSGAMTESIHVFFDQNGLREALKTRKKINILEIGLGTGLNVLLLMDALLDTKLDTHITYHSIEAFPISAKTAADMNHGDHLCHHELAKKLPSVFDRLKKGENHFQLTESLELTVFNGLFEDYGAGTLSFDFIFHDAFSPQVNPELWTGDVFKKLLKWSNPEGILTTYCAASQARGAMASAGWKVARAPGALGKREMTVASPTAKPLSHLKRINEERLARRYEDGDF